MYKMSGSQEYPHEETFLKYAAANCGLPAIYQGSHEEVEPDANVELLVYDVPRNIPVRQLYVVRVKIDAVRAAEYAVNRMCADRPFEGTVTRSDHLAINSGDTVLGLISRDCGALVVNTAYAEDMRHLVKTFQDNEYRRHVTL